MSSSPERCAAIVLAAGASTRLGEPKALARLDGEPIVARLVRLTHDVGIARIVVVVGPDEGVSLAVRTVVEPFDTTVVINEARDDGRTGSLQCGLRALLSGAPSGDAAFGYEGIVVLPADVPCVLADDIASIIAAASTPEAVAVLGMDGRGGHPVWIGGELVAEVLALGSDEPLRRVMYGDESRGWAPPSLALLDAGHEGPLLAVKTPDDLDHARNWLLTHPE